MQVALGRSASDCNLSCHLWSLQVCVRCFLKLYYITLSKLLSDGFLHMFWNVIQLFHGEARHLFTDMPKGELKKYHLSPESLFYSPILLLWKQQWKTYIVYIYTSLGFPVPFYNCFKMILLVIIATYFTLMAYLKLMKD